MTPNADQFVNRSMEEFQILQKDGFKVERVTEWGTLQNNCLYLQMLPVDTSA